MEKFIFTKKEQAKAYYLFTILSFILGLFIFFSLDIYINKHMAFLLVSILSFISISMSVREAGKTFEEIIVDEDKLSLKFQNKNKKKLEKQKSEVFYNSDEEKLEIWDKSSNELIGRAYKNRIAEKDDWEILIEILKT